VRAGRGGKYADEFIEEGLVATGWTSLDRQEPTIEKDELLRRLAKASPESSEARRMNVASQVVRFLHEVASGDAVGTYDSNQRAYFLGQIVSDVEWREHEALPRMRRVDWQRRVGRDRLSVSTRNSLGSSLTLFHLDADVREEMWDKSIPIDATEPIDAETAPPTDETEEDEVLLRGEIVNKAHDFVEDRIARLDWEEMQELVAGLLRAVGYQTRVSSPGPDRGVDIFASPDGLGLKEPRIFVEVKHRPQQTIGAPDLRAFIGGRQPGDRCLYVSTGGFTKDAYYEAERSSIPVTLVNLPQLRELVLDHYEKFDASITALLPLERLYWPAD
jgi:restriction system protein